MTILGAPEMNAGSGGQGAGAGAGWRARTSGLLRSQGPSAAFLIAVNVANALNFGFNLVAGRLLGTGRYGELGSLLTLVAVVGVIFTAVQLSVTQAASVFPLDQPAGLRVAFRRSIGVGALLAVVLLAASPLLTSFLRLPTATPLAPVAAWALFVTPAVVLQGALLGRLRYGAVAVSLIVNAVVRLVAGVVLMELGWGVSGAVGATTIAGVAALVVLLVATRRQLLGSQPPQLQLRGRDTLTAVAALGAFTVFTGVDTALARHYLAGDVAGYYAAAGTVGRVAMYLPGGLALVMFPRLALASGSSARQLLLLRRALAAVLGLATVAGIVTTVFPHLAIGLMFGGAYLPGANIVVILVWAFGAAAGVGLLLYYHQARHSAAGAAVAWAATALLVGISIVHHSTADAIAVNVLAISVSLLVVLYAAALGPVRSAVSCVIRTVGAPWQRRRRADL